MCSSACAAILPAALQYYKEKRMWQNWVTPCRNNSFHALWVGGAGKNWLRIVADKGFFVILPLYGPTEPFFNQTWKPGDIEEMK